MHLSALPRRAPWGRRLWQSFTLASVEEHLAHRTVRQSSDIRVLFERAVAQHEAARSMLERDDIIASFDLARASATLYARAILAGQGFGEPETSRDVEVWAELDLRMRAGELPEPPPPLADARELLAGEDASLVIDARQSDAVETLGQLLSFLDWMKKAIEPRSLTDVQHQRVRRLGALGLAVAAFTVLLGFRVLTPKNLALHKSVVVSSVHPQSTALAGALVDGSIDQTYGVHTNIEANPWVLVDLGTSQKLGKIKLYNRGDGWFDDALPLTLELSDDGTTFTEVERRTAPFSQSSPWVASVGGRAARYIRVRGKINGWVALSELEAYGP